MQAIALRSAGLKGILKKLARLLRLDNSSRYIEYWNIQRLLKDIKTNPNRSKLIGGIEVCYTLDTQKGEYNRETFDINQTIDFFEKYFVPQTGFPPKYCTGKYCRTCKDGHEIHYADMEYGVLGKREVEESPLRTITLEFRVESLHPSSKPKSL